MVSSYIIIIIFVIIFYHAATNENTQFAATASAIRQIWSGGCRLSCRGSQVSGLSGLHGEPPCQVGTSGGECVCDTCPCAMIENILRPFSPVTQIYSNVTHTASHYYYHALKSMVDAYEYVSRVMECGTSCRTQAKIVDTNEYDSEKFNFDDQNKDKKGETSKKIPKLLRSAIDLSKTGLTSKKSSISFKEPIKSESSDDGGGGKGSGRSKGSADTLKPAEETNSCPRCVSEGKTCIRECPHSKKHD